MAKRKAAPKTAERANRKSRRARRDGPERELRTTASISGKSVKPEYIWLRLANRHGLITGATGTGKTVTLQGLAEGFSDAGVPVFCADVKGDLSGVAEKGEPKGWIEERAKQIGYTVELQAYPVIFWDLFGEQGHPIRATVSEIGPLLLSRLMDLNDAQEGVLNIAFKHRRRREAAAARPQGPAGAARGPGRARRHPHHQIRQHHQGLGRLDPALAAGARAAGRASISSASRRSRSTT